MIDVSKTLDKTLLNAVCDFLMLWHGSLHCLSLDISLMLAMRIFGMFSDSFVHQPVRARLIDPPSSSLSCFTYLAIVSITAFSDPKSGFVNVNTGEIHFFEVPLGHVWLQRYLLCDFQL